ncbi:MAG: M23 family metallopeptidase, partial [Desulfobacteraceae bacterium]
MGKRKNIGLFITVGSLVIILGIIAWFLTSIFEGEKPLVTVEPLPEFLSGSEKFSLTARDLKRGLKVIKVSVNQEGREISVLEKKFPFTGLFNREGIHKFNTEFSLDPAKLNLAQGRVDLQVRVRDYSRRRGGDGNLSLAEHKMMVDTIPPAIRAISRMHYVNVGGTGFVVYQTSSDSVESGLFVNDFFFPGFEAQETEEGYHVCYFAVPHNVKPNAEIHLWAKDRAGNNSTAGFYCKIRRKSFRAERLNVTERFLKRILPYFSFYSLIPADTDINKFLKINRDLRQDNASVFYNLRTKTNPAKLWDGTWLRLKNAASMARFADRRLYYYKGKKVDEQVHMGVDLASLANSKVQAANNGRVIFADRLGIYGLTVVLDHGQG